MFFSFAIGIAIAIGILYLFTYLTTSDCVVICLPMSSFFLVEDLRSEGNLFYPIFNYLRKVVYRRYSLLIYFGTTTLSCYLCTLA